MKIQSFEDFIFENADNDSVEVQKLKTKLKGKPGLKTLVSMYKFYYEKGYADIKDPKELISKAEYYDQAWRKSDTLLDLMNHARISPTQIDKINYKLVEPFIAKVKPGTPEFAKVWIIVQHADHNVEGQKKFVELHGKEMESKDPSSFAMLKDRIAVNSGEPQPGMSQGMGVTLKGKESWVPRLMKGIKIEGEPVKAKNSVTGKEVILVKWADSETEKVNAAIEKTIPPAKIKAAKKAGVEINLKNYIAQVHGLDYLGNYMIKSVED